MIKRALDEMDGVEIKAGKKITEKINEGNSNDETEREVCEMLKGYDLGVAERENSLSPPRLELITHTCAHHSPPPAMDISSVLYRPGSVLTQADLTSTHGYPRLELPEMGRMNSSSNRDG